MKTEEEGVIVPPIPGEVPGVIFAVSNDGGKTGVAWRKNVYEAFAYLDMQNRGGPTDYRVVAKMADPIRTVDQFLAASAEYMAAVRVSEGSDDRDECRRAAAVQCREMWRMDEARDLFEFDDEGDLVGLKQG